jgi:hypothetical protein
MQLPAAIAIAICVKTLSAPVSSYVTQKNGGNWFVFSILLSFPEHQDHCDADYDYCYEKDY